MSHTVFQPSAEMSGSNTAGNPVRWSPLGRFAFRFAFCYLLLSVLVVFAPLQFLPLVGPKIGSAVNFLFAGPVEWIGQHLFHLTGVAAHPHATDSRDEALDWITSGLIVCLSLAAAVVWSALDRKRAEYQTASAWLRFVLRLSLVFLMLRYGLFKVFPLQMSPPSLAVLNEPLGNSSPMTLLWTLIGLHPGYEILCGAIETTAAVLLFFRRTALLGALLNAFVMTNVLIFNLFFDVPVKLGAAIILLVTLAVIAPDLRSLYQYFWLHKPSAPSGVWVPPGDRRSFRLGTRIVECAFLILVLYYYLPPLAQEASQQAQAIRHPSVLSGEWRVDSSARTVEGHSVDTPVLTAEGLPMTELYVEPDGQAMARSSDGRLWRAEVQVDLQKRMFTLDSGYFEGRGFQTTYAMWQPDSMHLTLTPTGDGAGAKGTVRLARIPLPQRYPILERKFQWVNEWALER